MTTVTVDVDVDLSDFDDEDIRDEYESRNLGGDAEDWDEHTEFMKAYRYEQEGKRDEAFAILWKFCLIKLNRIV